jgi:hypothetical protein
MWHLIARSVNVDSIALHSVKRGKSDSITFKYDQTKMDQTGEFIQEKNCYSNPHEAYLCLFTSLGCYLSVNLVADGLLEALADEHMDLAMQLM